MITKLFLQWRILRSQLEFKHNHGSSFATHITMNESIHTHYHINNRHFDLLHRSVKWIRSQYPWGYTRSKKKNQFEKLAKSHEMFKSAIPSYLRQMLTLYSFRLLFAIAIIAQVSLKHHLPKNESPDFFLRLKKKKHFEIDLNRHFWKQWNRCGNFTWNVAMH